MKKSIVISPDDSVGVALAELKKGENAEGITLAEDIARGHKFALKAIKSGEKVIKYGEVIGSATRDIAPGEHIHTHNMKTCLEGTLEYSYNRRDIAPSPSGTHRTVNVYERRNGEVGIRNELWVIPTVGCVNAQAKAIVSAFTKKHGGLAGVDGCFTYTHPYGCSQIGEDHERTKLLLQRMVKHPNCGGVLVLGLGCENNRMDVFRETLGEYDESRTRFLVAQDVGDEIAEGVKLLDELYEAAKNDRRVPKDISCLKVGLKCGGSDGLSGITANPLVGRFSDYMASVGGTTVLTEVPEMFGAETLLMKRCRTREIFGKCVKMINDFKVYYASHGQVCYENPSPGNKAGGITTLEDKSLGCVQKGGSAPVEDVLRYGERVKEHGLSLLSGPGNDLVSSTALAAAGAHLILFTTGRGTPFGCVVPTLKIASNKALADAKPGWIDWDAMSNPDAGEFAAKILRIASGEELAKNELAGAHGIAIFKDGVTL